MKNKTKNAFTTEIHDGGVVEIFACGGQCRGQNSSTMPFKSEPEGPKAELKKVI